MNTTTTQGRIWIFRALALLFIALISIGIFFIAETIDRNKGNVPGVLYKEFSFIDAAQLNRPIQYDQFYVADERGMTYINRQLYWLDGTEQFVNAQGFVGTFNYDVRTIDSLRSAGKKIVFILGDSFVQGVSDHADSTFTERLRRQHPEWALCTFGVGATGLMNYLLILQKFAAELKPDLVVVAICWNDILYRKAIATPHIPPVWQTELGWVESVIPRQLAGNEVIVTRSPQEAIDFYVNRLTLFRREDLLAKICRRSSLLTRLYKKYSEKDQLAEPIIDPLANERLLHEIEGVAQQAGSKLVFVFIPDPRKTQRLSSVHENRVWYKKNFRSFTNRIHFFAGTITADDYISKVNQHFDDAGNRKYAEWLDSVMVESLRDTLLRPSF